MKSYYGVYRSMVNRCTLKTDKSYPNYGGRGIKVCDRWLGKDGLKHFIEDMGKRPDESKEPGGKATWSIERKDNDKNYCPENCIWADRKTQANNKRLRKDSILLRNR